MSSASIQPIAEADLQDLALLMPQWGLPNAVTVEDLQAHLFHLRNLGGGDLLIARTQDGTLVGYIQLSEYVMLGVGVFAEVVAILVHDAYRGIGIGSSLMAEAEQWARARGLSQMILSSQVHRVDAHQLYLHLGYQHFKHSYYFTKTL